MTTNNPNSYLGPEKTTLANTAAPQPSDGQTTPRGDQQQSPTPEAFTSRRSRRMQAALEAEVALQAEQAALEAERVATTSKAPEDAPLLRRRRNRPAAPTTAAPATDESAETTTVFPPAAPKDAEPQPVTIDEILLPTPAWAGGSNSDSPVEAVTPPAAETSDERTELPVLANDSCAFLAAAFIAPPTSAHPPRATARRLSSETAINSVVPASSVARDTENVLPSERKSRWNSLRSTGIVALAIPGLLATVALPAYAFGPADGAVADANSQLASSSIQGQSLTVSDDVTLAELERDGYSATTSEELDAAYAKSTYIFDNATSLAAYLAPSASGWWRPLPGAITSKYGPRGLICNSVGCSNSFHEGMDFGGACGTPIKATAAGRVTFVGNAGAYGNRVIIDHGDGVETIYGHLLSGSYTVAVGDTVAGGDVIAEVGATGVVSGCHLDLKVNVDGEHTNPAPFLREKGVVV